MTCVLGIDPGLSGALGFYFDTHPTRVSVKDIPTADHRVDGATLTGYLEQLRPDIAIIELVGAMPGQGVTSMFNFGCAFGVLVGTVQALKIPHRFVTPQKWKKHFGLNSEAEKSRAMALRTFTDVPEHFARKKDHNRAEAALLALYGAQVIVGERAAA